MKKSIVIIIKQKLYYFGILQKYLQQDNYTCKSSHQQTNALQGLLKSAKQEYNQYASKCSRIATLLVYCQY